MDYKQQLKLGAEELEIELKEEMLDQFMIYMKLLKKWNQKINLTAINEPEEIIVKHFLDSLSCLKGINFSAEGKIIDVGTGAGFPGLPLKIFFPEFKVTLLDAVKKKVTFLQQLIYKLNLSNVEPIHGRAEVYGHDNKYRAQYDYALARAVDNLNIIAEYALPFVKIGGKFIAQKGKGVTEEVNYSKEAVKKLGGKITAYKSISLPFSSAERNLIIITKENSTPDLYPRSAGKPEKNPL